MPSDHVDQHLKNELYDLMREDSRVFEFIQTGSFDGLWYWDLENPSKDLMSCFFWEALGYKKEKMTDDPVAWKDIINTRDLEVALSNFDAHCKSPSQTYDHVVRYRHSDSSTVWIRCRALAIRDGNGKPLRMLGAHTNVTSLRKSEELLAQKNSALTTANDELTKFAFAASHDIQAPVRNIKGLLNILQEDTVGQLDEDNREILAMAVTAAQRLTELTSGILQFAETGNIAQNMREVDCQALLANIALDLQADLALNNTQLLIGEMPIINAIETPTRQLFQNLISNAIKFQRQGIGHTPRITLSSEPHKNGWKFTVADNGIGIDSANLGRVFHPFSRLNLFTDFKGSGLGLTLCQRAVQMHDGELWVESSLGDGATFHFTYPACALVS